MFRTDIGAAVSAGSRGHRTGRRARSSSGRRPAPRIIDHRLTATVGADEEKRLDQLSRQWNHVTGRAYDVAGCAATARLKVKSKHPG
jgi:hypothetical protein